VNIFNDFGTIMGHFLLYDVSVWFYEEQLF